MPELPQKTAAVTSRLPTPCQPPGSLGNFSEEVTNDPSDLKCPGEDRIEREEMALFLGQGEGCRLPGLQRAGRNVPSPFLFSVVLGLNWGLRLRSKHSTS